MNVNEIAFRRRLQHHKDKNSYVISIPRPIAELFQTDEIEIIVSSDGVKLQPVREDEIQRRDWDNDDEEW